MASDSNTRESPLHKLSTPQRPGSPDPWSSPSLALGAVPQLDRSVSTASSVSSRLSESGVPGRGRRGYIRPEGTQFSKSAKNRDSVQNLGTIAHLQYYFARTGLLDAATGRVAKSRKPLSRSVSGSETPSSASGLDDDFTLLSVSTPDGTVDPLSEGLIESPLDEASPLYWGDDEPIMLPPTVSTYKNTPVYVSPPPDMTVLRRELRESLEEAGKHLQQAEKDFGTIPTGTSRARSGSIAPGAPKFRHSVDAPGWFEIQGLNLLDVITLAIRAAKNYYTAHENTQRLYAIKSEREIRKELYEVLETLKRLAIRNFESGVQPYEVSSIRAWVAGIGKLLDTEEEMEQREREEREAWSWREGDWTGKERERELLFLKSFDPSPETLPTWTDPEEGELPTAFLSQLRTGLRLVLLHNSLVKKSRRQFEEIKSFHTDTAKPYRCADNIRYWAKAAELRWDIKLDVDAMGVVLGTDATAWKKFDKALMDWCRCVREEIIAEWLEEKAREAQGKTPTLRVDPNYEAS